MNFSKPWIHWGISSYQRETTRLRRTIGGGKKEEFGDWTSWYASDTSLKTKIRRVRTRKMSRLQAAVCVLHWPVYARPIIVWDWSYSLSAPYCRYGAVVSSNQFLQNFRLWMINTLLSWGPFVDFVATMSRTRPMSQKDSFQTGASG